MKSNYALEFFMFILALSYTHAIDICIPNPCGVRLFFRLGYVYTVYISVFWYGLLLKYCVLSIVYTVKNLDKVIFIYSF